MMRRAITTLAVLCALAGPAAAALEFQPADPIEGDQVWVRFPDRIAASPQRGECRTEHRQVRKRGPAETTISIKTTVRGLCAASELPVVEHLGRLPAGDYLVSAGGAQARLHVLPAATDPGPLTDAERARMAVALEVPIPDLACPSRGMPQPPRPRRPVSLDDWGMDQRLGRKLGIALPKLSDAERAFLVADMQRVRVTLKGKQFSYQIQGTCCQFLRGTGTLGAVVVVGKPVVNGGPCVYFPPV